MTIRFEHPVGAQADTKELEYISALLQTNPQSVRADATIDSHDVYYYLKSRHGLKVSRQYLEQHLIPELAGNIHTVAPPPPPSPPPVRGPTGSSVAGTAVKVATSTTAIEFGAATSGGGLTRTSSDSNGAENVPDNNNGVDGGGNNDDDSFHSNENSSQGGEGDDGFNTINLFPQNESFMDLCQVVSIMLIPFFVAASPSSSSRRDDSSNSIIGKSGEGNPPEEEEEEERDHGKKKRHTVIDRSILARMATERNVSAVSEGDGNDNDDESSSKSKPKPQHPKQQSSEEVFSKVLEVMVSDSFGMQVYQKYFGDDGDDDDDDDALGFNSSHSGHRAVSFGQSNSNISSGSNGEMILTKDLIRDILETYGEVAVPDRILEEMLVLAGGDGCALNTQALTRAMSSDVGTYNLDWLTTYATHYEDILGTKRTTDFWCMQTTRKIGGEVVSKSKEVVQKIGDDIIETTTKGGKAVVETTLRTRNKTASASSSSISIDGIESSTDVGDREEAESNDDKKDGSGRKNTVVESIIEGEGEDVENALNPVLEEASSEPGREQTIIGIDDDGAVQNFDKNDANDQVAVLPSTTAVPADATADAPAEADENGGETYQEFYSAPSIDYIAESFRSQTFLIVMWLALVIGYFAYFFSFESSIGRLNCEPVYEGEGGTQVTVRFFCLIGRSTVNWIAKFLYLSIIGTLVVFFGSFGAADSNSIWAIGVGMVTVTVFYILSYKYEVDTVFFDTTKKEGWDFFYLLSLLAGCVLLFLQLILALRVVLPSDRLMWLRRITVWMTNGMVRKEARTKAAEIFKINRLLDNALDLHQDEAPSFDNTAVTRSRSGGTTIRGGTAFLSSTGRALLNYQILEAYRAQSGGMIWGWKKIINKSIFREEGLIASNFFQVAVCGIVFFAVAFFVRYAVRFYDAAEATLPPGETYFPTWSPTAAPSMESGAPSYESTTNVDYIPKRWQLELAIFFGGVAGFFAALFIAFVYLPSAVSTILKFRYGEIPSLGNRTFQKYREAVDLIAMMFGSMFWGAIVTALVTFLFFGAVVFLFAYHITRPFAAWATAIILGFSITLGLKVCILSIFRYYFFRGMYRRKVAAANFLGRLSVGYMTVRALILLTISVVFVGRVDTPVLAEGVGYVGPIILDSYPITFRKDLLLHEAHRHPYIERLGSMMLMKIRFGADFSTQAGAMWRLLFVLALFPWLRKYRFPQMPSLPDELNLQLDLSDADFMEEGQMCDDARDDNVDIPLKNTDLERTEEGGENESAAIDEKDTSDNHQGEPSSSGGFLSMFGIGVPQTVRSEVPAVANSVPSAVKGAAAATLAMNDSGPRYSPEVDKRRRGSVNVRFADTAVMRQQASIRRLSKATNLSTMSPSDGRREGMTRRSSLAMLSSAAGGIQDREVLMQMENESLKKQVLRLQEQLQAMKAQYHNEHEKKNK